MDRDLDNLFSRLAPEGFPPTLVEDICSRLFKVSFFWKMARSLIASYRVSSQIEAGDCINSGLEKVHKALSSRKFTYQRPGSSFWWAYQVFWREANRLCGEAARKISMEVTSSQKANEDSEEDPITLIEEKEVHPEALNPREEFMRQEIRLAIELCFDTSLKKIEKQVLVLRYHQGRSITDVAEKLNIPLGSVGRYAYYAEAKIRDCLGKRYGINPEDFYQSL